MTLYKTFPSSQDEKKWVLALYFYFAIDLARIQQVIPGLSALRPGLLATFLLLFFLLSNSKQIGYVYRFPQIKCIVFFICLLFTYIPFADGARSAYQAAMGMLQYLPCIIATVMLINSKARLVQLIRIYGIILVFVCFFSLLHGGRGPGGSIIDENDLCLFIVCIMPFLFFIYQQERKASLKMFWLMAVGLSLATIVTTFSRGGFVGLIVMGSVYWWFSKKKAIVALLIICLGGAVVFFAGDSYIQEMRTVTNASESTANERLLSWQAGINMFLDNPLGVGGNNYPRNFPNYQPEEFGRNMWGRAAHSLWFTLIPETGLIGIVLYFSIIIVNLKALVGVLKFNSGRTNNDDLFFKEISVALLASLFAFFAAGTFISVLYYPIFWYLTALVVSVQNIHSSQNAT